MMSRMAVLLLPLLLLPTGALRAEEQHATDPTAPLKARTYCLAPLPDGRIAAGATYGVLFYGPPENEGTVHAPARPHGPSQGLALPDSVNDLLFHGRHLYVANGPRGIVVVDPGSAEVPPRSVGEVETAGAVMGLAAEGDVLAAALGVMGVALYDISDPASPRELGLFDTDGYARGVQILEDKAGTEVGLFVANGRGGIARLIVSRADWLVTSAHKVALDGDVRQLLLTPSHWVVSRGTAGVCTLDRTLTRESLTCVAVKDVARGIATAPGRVLVADGGEGVLVLKGPGLKGELTEEGRHKWEAGSMNRIYRFGDTVYLAADYASALAFSLSSLDSPPASPEQP